MDPDTFRHHDKCVSYALSYLCGSTQCHFDTQLEDEDEVDFMPPNWLNDWPCFVEELHEMFGDLNAEATVEAELDMLCMWTNQSSLISLLISIHFRARSTGEIAHSAIS